MSRYTRKQLRAMARQVLRARESGNPKWMELVLRISMIHGYDPDYIISQIERLAE